MFAGFDVPAHVVRFQRVADISHRGAAFAGGAQFGVLVHGEAARRLAGQQPVRHRGHRRTGHVNAGERQRVDRFDEEAANVVGKRLCSRIDDEPAVRRIDPYAGIAANAERARQQFVGDLLLEFAQLLSADLEALLLLDFKRTRFDAVATVERLEYDPNRTAWIALVKYEDGELAYILAPQRLAAGDKVISSLQTVDVKPGNAMPLERMPVGTIVHNVEMKPRKGGQIARSAGAYAQYVGRDSGWAILRLNSGEQRRVHGSCLATVGAVSNQDHSNTVVGKAGRSRWLGIRPQTRGIAMNPVDHPHGGRTKGGMHWTTPWGGAAKGQKTRSNKRTDKFIVRSRHVKKGR